MKIVLDVNVIVAGLATRGLASEVVEFCLRPPWEIWVSQEIVDDVQRILTLKFKVPLKEAAALVSHFQKLSQVVMPKTVVVPNLRDKDDEVIIGTAVSSKAGIIVTGDEDLLVLKHYQDIVILSPRQFHQRYLHEIF